MTLDRGRPMKRTRNKPAHGAPTIDFIVESDLWKRHRGIRPALRRAIAEAANLASKPGGELAVVLSDDAVVRGLNRNWRGKDQPTNVLSFPAGPHGGGQARHRGDIVIAYETTAREAQAQHKPFLHHVTHLAVHGFLHLAGYDHEADDEAEAMEALETAILARLDVPNPYMMNDA
jgi:probable rRNA maturation factor